LASNKKELKSVSQKETADFLREVADSLEKGETVSNSLAPLEFKNLKSLEIEIKQKEPELFNIKIRSKTISTPGEDQLLKKNQSAESPGLNPEPDREERLEKFDKGKLKYKKLKKIMEEQFKQIHDILAMNQSPDTQLMLSFFQNSNLMVSFKDRGEIHYEPYISALERFKTAVSTNDLLSCKVIYKELNQIKIDCHKEYK